MRAALQDSDAVMVIDDGKPVGVLTRADLLAFLAGRALMLSEVTAAAAMPAGLPWAAQS